MLADFHSEGRWQKEDRLNREYRGEARTAHQDMRRWALMQLRLVVKARSRLDRTFPTFPGEDTSIHDSSIHDSGYVRLRWGQNAMGWVHEILRQRQSLNILPYFGQSTVLTFEVRDKIEIEHTPETLGKVKA